MATNVRSLCLDALLAVDRKSGFADAIIEQLLRKHPVPANDAGLLRELFYGILRNRSRLDFLIEQLVNKPLDGNTRNLLRIGLYQIFHMRVPNHAAVNETVNLGGRARGLINAVLRRALREQEALSEALEQQDLATRFSHPEFLVRRWSSQFGDEEVERLLSWNNSPAPIVVRTNTLRTTREALLADLASAKAIDNSDDLLEIPSIPGAWLKDGLVYIQDPSTLGACQLLAPTAKELVLDACAAPGGKTTYLAQMMENRGRILACDSSHDRIRRLCENIERMGVENTEVRHCDWTSKEELPPAIAALRFDKILIDAPCSNTGVMRRRVDVRWRLSESDFVRMQSVQLRIIRRILPLLKSGGTLVYSTCSLEPEENEQVVGNIDSKHPELKRTTIHRTTPLKDAVDGSFAAAWVLS